METQPDPRPEPPTTVEFARGYTLALAGLIAGVAIALLVPLIVLKYGHDLTNKMQLTAIIVAVSLGGLVALTAAFFGTVMPTAVGHGHGMPPPQPPSPPSPPSPPPPPRPEWRAAGE